MEPTHIFYKHLPIDENNVFTANVSKKNEVQNILFRKSNEYAIIVLVISQNADNLIEVTDRNRKRILQELIENLLKEGKEEEHVYGLKIYQSEGYEKLVPLTKKTSADLRPIKFKYYSLQTEKPEEIDFYDYYGSLEKFGFKWEDTNLAFKYTVEFSSDKK